METWSSVLSLALVGTTLMFLTPILLAAIGGAITQQADILNIGLEGLMLVGAFSAIAVGAATKSALAGVLAAVVSALLLSVVYAVCTLWLKADFIVVGIGVNILALGLTVFLLQTLYGSPGSTPASVTISLPKPHVPVLGDQTALVYLALLCVPAYAFLLYRTRFGVHLRAVGENLPAATAAGIDGTRVKFISVMLCGALCGLAGAQLSMANLGSFTTNMTAGRGFIAVAALTFGRARPVPTLVAAVIFGLADAVADRLGVAGVNSNLAKMAPYIITIVALTLASMDIMKRRRRSAALKEA
ncbi:MAG: ABC transporter permease [Actinomycetia bacterium]|nr:ABC transporter permease [Actinomycetes bacterium]